MSIGIVDESGGDLSAQTVYGHIRIPL